MLKGLKTRLDSWANVMTGMGILGRDRRNSTRITQDFLLDRPELLAIYRSDGLGKNIVTVPADDMVREWIDVTGDPDNLAVEALVNLQAKDKFKEALYWSRLFGGSVILMGIDDGQDLEMPVNEKNIREVFFLEVYERKDVYWATSDLYNDPSKPKYGSPEFYHFTNRAAGKVFRAHESRVLRFDGEILPYWERMANQSWGDSVLQSPYERLRGIGDSLGGAENAVMDFSLNVYKIPNLQSLLSQPDGEALVRKRMNSLDLTRHIMNSLVLDGNEEFSREALTNVTGLEKILSILLDILAGVTKIPRVKLLGEQSKGLGSEAAGNLRLYYDEISSQQESQLSFPLKILVNYIMLSKEGPFKGVPPENWAIKFKSLWQVTEEEQEKTRKLTAERDKIYVEMGLPPEAVISSRFGGGDYSAETKLPEDYVNYLNESLTAKDFSSEDQQI